jgi:Fe-S-cluster containining protein
VNAVAKKKKTEKEKTKKVHCRHCTGLCCRYFALPIETPTARSDYDDIRWYLSHQNTEVFVEDGDWYLNVINPCRHLAADHTCANYDRRPKICRTYKIDDCDLTSDDYGYELHFTSDRQIEDYMKGKFGLKVFERYNKVKKKKRAKQKKSKK